MIESGLVEDTTMPETINGVDCHNSLRRWGLRDSNTPCISHDVSAVGA